MRPILNPDILLDICIQTLNENGCIPWNFALASGENLKIFINLLKTVKNIKFVDDGIEAIFNWGTFSLRFDDPNFSKTICMKLLSYATEIQFVSLITPKHLELLQKANSQKLSITSIDIPFDSGYSLYQITKLLPAKNLKISSSSLLFINSKAGMERKATTYQNLHKLYPILENPSKIYYQLFDRNYLLQDYKFQDFADQEKNMFENRKRKYDDDNEYEDFQEKKEKRKNKLLGKYEKTMKDYNLHLEAFESHVSEEQKNFAEPSLNPSKFGYKSVEITVNFPYVFNTRNMKKLKSMLRNYCLNTKDMIINFTGQYNWVNIFNIFTTIDNEHQRNPNSAKTRVVYGPPNLFEHQAEQLEFSLQKISRNYDENFSKEFYSTSLENLTLHLENKFIKPLNDDELKLNNLLENLQKCFPNLKYVDFWIDLSEFQWPVEEEQTSKDIYIKTYQGIFKQIEDANISYYFTLDWFWPKQIISKVLFHPIVEALTNILGYKKIVGTVGDYECEKQISRNKELNMIASLELKNH